MELLIRQTAGDPATDIGSFVVDDNAKALKYANLAILKNEDDVKEKFGLTDQGWSDKVGDDFHITGNSELPVDQAIKAILFLIRKFWMNEAQDGNAVRLANAAQEDNLPIPESDFSDIDLEP